MTRRWSATRGFRRFLTTPDGRHVALDKAQIADDAKFDGIFVLRTNTRLSPLQAMLRYRDLMTVERLFSSAKARLETWPIRHRTDAAIRGHVFCSFLTLVLAKALEDRLAEHGLKIEWADLLADLDRPQEIALDLSLRRLVKRAASLNLLSGLRKADFWACD